MIIVDGWIDGGALQEMRQLRLNLEAHVGKESLAGMNGWMANLGGLWNSIVSPVTDRVAGVIGLADPSKEKPFKLPKELEGTEYGEALKKYEAEMREHILATSKAGKDKMGSALTLNLGGYNNAKLAEASARHQKEIAQNVTLPGSDGNGIGTAGEGITKAATAVVGTTALVATGGNSNIASALPVLASVPDVRPESPENTPKIT